jgi:hypothetical protein
MTFKLQQKAPALAELFKLEISKNIFFFGTILSCPEPEPEPDPILTESGSDPDSNHC